MKRVLLALAVAALLAPAAQLVFAKAHVPLGMVQVCSVSDDDDDDDGGGGAGPGVVKNIDREDLAEELDEGGCRLTACAFNMTVAPDTVFVFQAGQACVPVVTATGFCPGFAPADVAAAVTIEPAVNGIGVTAACTDSH